VRRIGALQVKLQAVLLTALALFAFVASPLQAQSPSQSAVIAPGFAIVSGFSGTVPTRPSLPLGANPADTIAIHSDGVSLRAIDTSRLGGPPSAQVVPARKILAIPASQIGQVFAITLDDAAPPNI
jgi:hypothetical protein